MSLQGLVLGVMSIGTSMGSDVYSGFQLCWKIPWKCPDNINSMYHLFSGHETPSTEFSNATEIHCTGTRYREWYWYGE